MTSGSLLQYLMDFKYLTSAQLRGFDVYKYKSIDTSPLSKYVMHPFWNQAVKLCPLWLSANVLTLLGWSLTVAVFLSLSYYDPHFMLAFDAAKGNSQIPRFVWLFCAFGQFMAHTLDGIDGKQARRTGTGSPLGELFDHGLDSTAAWLMGIGILSLFGLGDDTVWHWECYFIIVTVLFGFYIAHWEKYNTSVMFLPWAYDISQIWLAGSYLATFAFGLGLWKIPIPGFGGWTICPLFKRCFFFLVALVVVPFSLFNQYRARKETPADCPSVIEGLMPLVSLFSVTSLFTLWGYISADQLIITQLRLFLVAYGLLYANLNCRLIVAQMSSNQCDRFNVLALPIIPILIVSYLRLFSDTTILRCYTAFLVVAHIHYGVVVVQQLCDHLNIYCFSVSKPPAKVDGQSSSANGVLQSKPASHDEKDDDANGAVMNGYADHSATRSGSFKKGIHDNGVRSRDSSAN